MIVLYFQQNHWYKLFVDSPLFDTRFKSTFQSVVQIIDNRLIRVSYSSQRPDLICSPFSPAFKLTWLVDTEYSRWRGAFFLSHKQVLSKEWTVSLRQPVSDCFGGFLPVRPITSLFRAARTSGSLLTHAVDHWPEGRRISTA